MSETIPEAPIPREILQAAHPTLPSPGFAERVVAASREAKLPQREHPERVEETRRRWRGASIAAVAVAAAVLLAVALERSRVEQGQASAGDQRQSFDLPGGSVAVLEPGTAIRWERTGNEVSLVQEHGEAFYRVDKGGRFEVATPAGRVNVLGTCFSVIVEEPDMSRKKTIAAAGLAVAVSVGVYEGSVMLANDHGEIRGEAGDRLEATSEEPPHQRAPIDNGVVLALAQSEERVRDQRQYIHELEAELEADVTPAAAVPQETPAERADRCLNAGPVCSYVDPSPAELAKLAECGRVRVDVPPILGTGASMTPSKALIEAAGLNPGQVVALTEVNRRFHEEHKSRLLDVYRELGGPSNITDELSIEALEAAVGSLLSQDAENDALLQLARERAGQRATEADEGTAQAAVRLSVEVGNRYEAAVAGVLGPAEARAVRLSLDGWGGSHQTWADSRIDCD